MPRDRCKHDMIPDQCAWCTGRDGGETERKRRDKSLIDRRRAIPARYAGTCGGCGDRYPEGTPISKRDGDREWRASCCLDDNGAPTR